MTVKQLIDELSAYDNKDQEIAVSYWLQDNVKEKLQEDEDYENATDEDAKEVTEAIDCAINEDCVDFWQIASDILDKEAA